MAVYVRPAIGAVVTLMSCSRWVACLMPDVSVITYSLCFCVCLDRRDSYVIFLVQQDTARYLIQNQSQTNFVNDVQKEVYRYWLDIRWYRLRVPQFCVSLCIKISCSLDYKLFFDVDVRSHWYSGQYLCSKLKGREYSFSPGQLIVLISPQGKSVNGVCPLFCMFYAGEYLFMFCTVLFMA